MANIYPTQQRTIDPYAEYNSNATNRLNRVSTFGENCILIPAYLNTTIDSTNQITISPGKCVIDDVIIEVTAPFVVDFNDADFYLSSSPFNEAGIYYLTLYYKYVKAKPAPRAYVQIFKNSERSLWNENYLFLKAIKVEFTGTQMIITDAYDADPTNSARHRRYLPNYILVSATLPTWTSNDVGKFLYNEEDGSFYLGGTSGWVPYSNLFDFKNTSLCDVGSFGYLDGTDVKKAIATDLGTLATCVVLKKGTETAQTGIVALFGVIQNVLIESGKNISYGDALYLSRTESGTATNVAPSGIAQKLGYAVEDGTNNIKIWFCPDIHLASLLEKSYKVRVSPADTVPTFLATAIAAGTGISTSILNAGADETLSISVTGKASISATDTTPGFLQNKISAGTGILLSILNVGGNEILRISSTGSGGEGGGGGVVVGAVIPYAGSSAPDGFLICDGTLYDSTAYPLLYDAIGEQYNESSDPAGYFRVPDCRHRVIVGLDSTSSFFNDLGEMHSDDPPGDGDTAYGTIAMNYLICYSSSTSSGGKVKVSHEDQTAGYLSEKLVDGDGISFEVVNDGSEETYKPIYEAGAETGLWIKSTDGINVIIAAGSIIINKKMYNINTSTTINLASNLRSGESLTTNTRYYIYATITGTVLSFKFSAVQPTKNKYFSTVNFNDNKHNTELYHPDEGLTWRYIGSVYYSSSIDPVALFYPGIYNSFPAGTKMLFLQASAPFGWTISTSIHDRLIRVVNDGTGGSTGGSWVISGLTVLGHILTVSEMPSHTHVIPLTIWEAPTGSYAGLGNNPGATQLTNPEGGNQPHSHGISSSGSWRPQYVNVIVCVKDA